MNKIDRFKLVCASQHCGKRLNLQKVYKKSKYLPRRADLIEFIVKNYSTNYYREHSVLR